MVFRSDRNSSYAKITIFEFEGACMISFILTAKRLLPAILVAVKDKVFISLFTTLLIINSSGVSFYTKLKGWGYLDAIYFALVSFIPSSIDIVYHPETTLGKVFTMMFLVVGVGVTIALIAVIAKSVVNIEKEDTILRELYEELNFPIIIASRIFINKTYVYHIE